MVKFFDIVNRVIFVNKRFQKANKIFKFGMLSAEGWKGEARQTALGRARCRRSGIVNAFKPCFCNYVN